MSNESERIDTSKYEGHALSLESVLSGYFTIEQIKEVDKTLMEDAPEILAELKRCYESEDRLLELLQIIEYKYDIPVKQIAAMMSI